MKPQRNNQNQTGTVITFTLLSSTPSINIKPSASGWIGKKRFKMDNITFYKILYHWYLKSFKLLIFQLFNQHYILGIKIEYETIK